jgi:multidrug efflux system membrane fusion protein
VNALLFRAEGVRAAVVDDSGNVQLKPVVIGRDYGRDVEVLSGVEASDAVVLNPPDSLEDGEHVAVKEAGTK